MTEQTNLVQRLAKAAADVGGKLKADKRNSEQNYDYVSADKILSACGQALATNGVMVVPSIVKRDVVTIEYTNQYGKTLRRYDAVVDLVLKVTDGTSSFEEPWYGMGSDYSAPDKAMYKAITSGHKYFMAKLFCIGEGNEDSEHESEPEGKAPAAPKQAQPAPKPAAPRAAEEAQLMREITGEAPMTTTAPAMTLDEAKAITNRDGEKYGDLDTPKLALMANAITKKLRGQPVSAEERAEAERKHAAITIILNSREQ